MFRGRTKQFVVSVYIVSLQMVPVREIVSPTSLSDKVRGLYLNRDFLDLFDS